MSAHAVFCDQGGRLTTDEDTQGRQQGGSRSASPPSLGCLDFSRSVDQLDPLIL